MLTNQFKTYCMSLNSQSLFAEMETKTSNGYLRKEHRVEEYDVWVDEDKHFVPKEMEDEMYKLGFTQWSSIWREQINPVNNINLVEFRQWWGVFFHDGYEVKFCMEKKDVWRMLIFPPNSQLTIDDGQYYTYETGLTRLYCAQG